MSRSLKVVFYIYNNWYAIYSTRWCTCYKNRFRVWDVGDLGHFVRDNSFQMKFRSELVIELSHRVVSGTVGILVVILSVWSWSSIGHIRETKFLAFNSIFFLVLQGLIGAAAVKWGQSDFVLATSFWYFTHFFFNCLSINTANF